MSRRVLIDNVRKSRLSCQTQKVKQLANQQRTPSEWWYLMSINYLFPFLIHLICNRSQTLCCHVTQKNVRVPLLFWNKTKGVIKQEEKESSLTTLSSQMAQSPTNTTTTWTTTGVSHSTVISLAGGDGKAKNNSCHVIYCSPHQVNNQQQQILQSIQHSHLPFVTSHSLTRQATSTNSRTTTTSGAVMVFRRTDRVHAMDHTGVHRQQDTVVDGLVVLSAMSLSRSAAATRGGEQKATPIPPTLVRPDTPEQKYDHPRPFMGSSNKARQFLTRPAVLQVILVTFTSGIICSVIGVVSLKEPYSTSQHLPFRIFYPLGTFLMMAIFLLKIPKHLCHRWMRYSLLMSLLLIPVVIMIVVLHTDGKEEKDTLISSSGTSTAIHTIVLTVILYAVQLVLSFSMVMMSLQNIQYF